jgi:integrase
VGAHGKVTSRQLAAKKWEATCRVRDSDGKRRAVIRTATTKGRAETLLQEALDERVGVGAELGPDTPLAQMAERWRRGFAEMVDTGERTPSTLRTYESVLQAHILPALGELTVREATVTRLDRFVTTLRRHQGANVTKTCRCVLNGIMGYAVRHGALGPHGVNPMREVSRVPTSPARKPRALTAGERGKWFTALGADQQAVDRDLPDLSRFLLATGVRIGEALAVSFMEVDFAQCTVSIDFGLVAVKGRGLRRMRTKTKAGERTLRMPGWAMEMLLRRYEALGEGPVFPAMRSHSWRDPSNTEADFREARAKIPGLEWVTTHNFRKTVATQMSDAQLTGREIADQLGHAKISMTQDVYLGRAATTQRHADVLETLRPEK